DVLIYQIGGDEYLVVVNASNTERDLNWLLQHHLPGVVIEDSSEVTALLALQGPAAEQVLQRLTSLPLAQMRRFPCAPGMVAGIECVVSRRGYTGGDGFELFTQGDAGALWDALLHAGSVSAKPCGLGARDVLRIEAGNVLYGHEIGEGVSPVAADLMWAVK